ncbi:unnamed protein product [Clonostachys byssicola]|uniref:Uncharacterized protein n=1 Tax=Clonostachys byssicola TaxID=160290 RepID=A0A9N9UMH8_9HYPO|nr:unnamed protein product [Clonostachys byssicola]
MSGLEVLGAVAAAVQLTQLTAKTVGFVRKISEIGSQYSDLCDEINFIKDICDEVQKHSSTGNITAGFLVQKKELLESTKTTLEEISKQLEIIKEKSERFTKQGEPKASKTKWIIREGKIATLLEKAQKAKTNLSISMNIQSAIEIGEANKTMQAMSLQIHEIYKLMAERMLTQECAVIFARDKSLIQQVDDVTSMGIREFEVDDQYPGSDRMDPQVEEPLTVAVTDQTIERTTAWMALQKKCSYECRCRCHANLCQLSIGPLRLSFRPPTAMSKWERDCGCNKSEVLSVGWRLPGQRYADVLACGQTYSLYALRPARTIPWAQVEWRYPDLPVYYFRRALQQGMILYPDDQDETGLMFVEHLINYGAFEILEVLLTVWGTILPKQRFSRCAKWGNLTRRIGCRARRSMRHRNCDESRGRLLKQVMNYAEDELEPEMTPLHEAARQGWGMEEAVGALKLHSYTTDAIDARDETGYPALHVAVMKGHHRCAQVLIEAGADVNRQATDGYTPLMVAASYHQIGIMRLLLSRGDSRNRIDRRERRYANGKNRNGRTALHVAAVSCNPKAVQLLLDEGASASERDSYGYTPLHYVALQVGSDSIGISQVGRIFELLLGTGGADINATDFYGQPPLMLAVARNRLAVTQHLINAGASHTSVTTKSENILHHAAFYSNLDMLQLLHHLELSKISVRLHDIGGDNPWDVFKRRLHLPPEHELHGRIPTKEEGDAFVNLYRGIRERNNEDDCSLLTQALDCLLSANPAASCRHLSMLIENKKACGELEPAGYYSGIKGSINAGDHEAAIKWIEDDLRELRHELATDPWDQTSRWDSPGPLVFR